jgi:G3E family GTPase
VTDPTGRIPFTLLGGYLGAGKTTLLNRLLTAPTLGGRRVAVLVNDVGAVNVDAAMIADHDGPTLTLTNGCVCCAVTDDLTGTLEEVRGLSPPPDHVVMELSGVGEPARLAAWANTTGFRLDGIVVMADTDQIVELAARRFVGDTVRSQLASADLVVLSKTDISLDVGAARRFVAEWTEAPVVDGADVDPAVLLGVGGVAPVQSDDVRPDRHLVETVDVPEVSRADLAALVDGLPRDVIRAKGLVRCVDVSFPVEVQVVGRRRTLRDRPDRADGHGAIVVIRTP